MTTIVRGKKLTTKTEVSDVVNHDYTSGVCSILLPSLAVYKTDYRQPAEKYQLRHLYVIVPKGTSPEVAEFIEAGVTSSALNTPMIAEMTKDIPFVAIGVTNSWIMVYTTTKNPMAYPKGYDIHIDESLIEGVVVSYNVSIPEFADLEDLVSD